MIISNLKGGMPYIRKKTAQFGVNKPKTIKKEAN